MTGGNTMTKTLVAKEDLLVHRKTGAGLDMQGKKVDLTEGLNLRAGDPVPVEELASYQQEALKDPDSNLSKLVTEVSEEEFARIRALKEGPVVSTNEDVTPKPEGDATVTKTAAKEGS